MHRLVILIGAMAVTVIFGLQWGKTGGIASGILGAIVGIALASGIDEPVSLPGALLRWLALIAGGGAIGASVGYLVDWTANARGATTPASVVGGVIGLLLCSGIRAR